MATRKVIKTMFEVRDEKSKLEGKLEGELKGLRKGVLALLMTTNSTNAQIAKMLDVEEEFVKSIRQEFLASQQQG